MVFREIIAAGTNIFAPKRVLKRFCFEFQLILKAYFRISIEMPKILDTDCKIFITSSKNFELIIKKIQLVIKKHAALDHATPGLVWDTPLTRLSLLVQEVRRIFLHFTISKDFALEKRFQSNPTLKHTTLRPTTMVQKTKNSREKHDIV